MCQRCFACKTCCIQVQKQWYLAKQTTKVSKWIQTNFTLCHRKSKDIEFKHFNLKSNYIQFYKQNKTWATLHPIWFFRVRYSYDSSLVLKIKKERFWILRSLFIWVSILLLHTLICIQDFTIKHITFHFTLFYFKHVI